ncbi:MAG: manganese efflux pump MntP family protein [Lachnospiraceae bacterium]|nr:manganese efflux pump MntP family protein [Lachnospiraceae bacterium]
MWRVIFVVVLASALSLGIFAMVVQRGALLVRFDRRTGAMAFIWGAISLLMTLAGYGIGRLVLLGDIGKRDVFWVHVVCGIFLVLDGFRMFYRAFEKKTFIERRMEKVDMRQESLLCLQFAVSSMMAGIVCGLLEIGMIKVILSFFGLSTVSAVIGYFNGRANGPAYSDRAYLAGGVILCAAGVWLQLAA